MLSSSLRQRLGDLIREGFGGRPAGRSNGAAAPRPAPPDPRFVRTGIEELLTGGVIEGPQGTLFIHERLYTEIGERPAPVLERFAALSEPGPANGSYPDARYVRDLPAVAAQADPPERGLFRRFGYKGMLFLDIETCGLSGGPVFLAGICQIGEGDLVLRQLFARDYGEERALLHEICRLAEQVDFLVTFNGKAFDVPFLRDRATHHRMSFPHHLPHLDLLWMARRRWKGHLPDCRLKTLEWHVLRRRRAGDVWGAEIPGLYHDYVQRGEPHRLIPVFHHNMLDVVAMVELIAPLFDSETEIY